MIKNSRQAAKGVKSEKKNKKRSQSF